MKCRNATRSTDSVSSAIKGSSSHTGAGKLKTSYRAEPARRLVKPYRRNAMSILRLAVETIARKTGQGIREILAAAYYKKYGKQMPEAALMEDVRRWNHGECNIPYLYDWVMDTQTVNP